MCPPSPFANVSRIGRKCGFTTYPLYPVHPCQLCSVPAAGHLVVRAVGNEREYAGPLDCTGQRPLVLRAHARLAPRLHLVPVRDEPAKPAHILVIDVLHLVHAERADLAPRIVAGPAAPSLESALTATAAPERRSAATSRSRTAGACRAWCAGRCWTWSCRSRCWRRTARLFCSHVLSTSLS